MHRIVDAKWHPTGTNRIKLQCCKCSKTFWTWAAWIDFNMVPCPHCKHACDGTKIIQSYPAMPMEMKNAN